MKDLIYFLEKSLKYFYEIGTDHDQLHEVEYSIHQKSREVRKSNCRECLKPFKLFRDVKARIPETLKELHVALSEAIKNKTCSWTSDAKFCSGRKDKRNNTRAGFKTTEFHWIQLDRQKN